MKIPSQIATSLSHPNVVGTVHSGDSLSRARKIRPAQCDWLELRVDNFFPNTSELLRTAPMLHVPRIVTVRHPSQGGAATGMTPRQRRALYSDFLPCAGLVDIELRQAPAMRDIIHQARERGAAVIFSHHDFLRTPPVAKLRELARRARDAGADVFKVAAMTRGPGDLAKLLEFLADEKGKLPLAVMGMGDFGKISRIALAQAGSCLNYGYLGKPNATGQWPVALLKARIAELTGAA
jgi:3-dehydroquinate dehydratase-1